MSIPSIIRSALAVALFACAACVAHAQTPASEPAIPDTPAGRQLANWLAAFASDDPEALATFQEEQFPTLHAPPGGLARLREMSGGFELVSIDDASATEITATLRPRARQGAFNRLTLTVEPEPPGRITDMGIMMGAPPPAAVASAAGSSESDADWRAQAMSEAADLLEANYVYADKGAQLAAFLRENQDAYDDVSDKAAFAAALTEDLRAVVPDGHLRVQYAPGGRPGPVTQGMGGAGPAELRYCMTAGLEHRIGGLEKQDVTGNISYDPQNHEFMVHMRHNKVMGVRETIPTPEVMGPEQGDWMRLFLMPGCASICTPWNRSRLKKTRIRL